MYRDFAGALAPRSLPRLARARFAAGCPTLSLALEPAFMPFLRILPLQRQVESPLENFFHIPFWVLDPEDFGKPHELLLEGFPGGEAEAVELGARRLEEARRSRRRQGARLLERKSRPASLLSTGVSLALYCGRGELSNRWLERGLRLQSDKILLHRSLRHPAQS